MVDPFNGSARETDLRLVMDAACREQCVRVKEVETENLAGSGVSGRGFHPIMGDAIRCVAEDVAAEAIAFEERAACFQLKRLKLHGECDNPYEKSREEEAISQITRIVNAMPSRIQTWNTRLWTSLGKNSHDKDLCRSIMSNVAGYLRSEFDKRRAEFELRSDAIRRHGDGEATIEDTPESMNLAHRIFDKTPPNYEGGCAKKDQKLADQVRQQIQQVPNLPDSAKMAFLSYAFATTKLGPGAKHEEAHKWLLQRWRTPPNEDWGGLNSYSVLNFKAWSTELQNALKAMEDCGRIGSGSLGNASKTAASDAIDMSVEPRKGGRAESAWTAKRRKFAQPRRDKGDTWQSIYDAYTLKYPHDVDASADTIRLACSRKRRREPTNPTK